LRAEAKKPIKSRKTGAKLYASTVSKLLVELRSSPNDNQTDISNIRTSNPGNLLVPGFFYM
jgi:hypothetical protein